MSNSKSIASAVFDSVLARLPLTTRRRILFYRAHGKFPRLKDPKSFSEKITWRILNDHSERLKWTCDKMEMKRQVVRLDPNILPVPTIWNGTDLQEALSLDFPSRWVLKPNHSSGLFHIGEGQPTLGELLEVTRGWLEVESRFSDYGEWAYQFAQPSFVLEPWIGGATNNDVPADYKIFVFHGVPELVQVHVGRGDAHSQYHYYPDWTPAPVTTSISGVHDLPVPATLPEMLRQASIIAEEFDFMRIDFYDVDGRVYFGETTPYPASGRRKFTPSAFDDELGSHWKLPGAS
jgi:hypothetical protein